MKTNQPIRPASNFRFYEHLLIWIVAAAPLYFLYRTYTNSITIIYDEEIALLATFGTLIGVYSGRYLAQLWSSPGKEAPDWLFALLLILMVGAAFFTAHFAGALPNHLKSIYVLFLGLPLFLFCVTTGMFIKLIRSRVQNQLQAAQVQAEHSQSELHLLQSQLSPHFLFNTLNNLYGISISQPDKTPTLLLKLSELLRYSVYDAKELLVPLPDELTYIKNYIDFETLRIGNKLSLTTAIDDITDTRIRIAPMLLIVFVENAFKHARNTTDQSIVIDIMVKLWGNSILFSVKNSYSPSEDVPTDLNKRSGLGLANVRQRLSLLYPNAHELVIHDSDGYFTVHLQLRHQ